MNGFRTTERRLYQQVADQIRGLIQAGQFRLGQRLPSERELALQLGVSRPSLREALIALEIDGTVEIRMGSGIYLVANTERRAATSASMGESPVELMQARAAVESAVIVLASSRMTTECLKTLRQILDGMAAEIAEGRKPVEHDRQFHLTIASQSGNGVLARLVGELFDDRHSPLSTQLREHFETPDTWSMALFEHEQIYTALEGRDSLLAQAMMHAHLEESKRRWLDSEPR
ncbi:GntR family transcriptional repressor for pyruvate dehydrogenase complex [Neorhizobium galegae]|uniref:FadR/GntR family transcriptional regulator n=1 Tax=Rhizobium/Agrobacterium group TaxID=227290 RepID=UPI001AE2E20E|nr:FadR/GntR family transcriptional regulator [Neorhizobium galegae]MBP2549810.1 GntR family transcriptional repressor for pyruvate dehydrogenase complex [Neorhizobium galegae]